MSVFYLLDHTKMQTGYLMQQRTKTWFYRTACDCCTCAFETSLDSILFVYESSYSFNISTVLIYSLGIIWHPVAKNIRIFKVDAIPLQVLHEPYMKSQLIFASWSQKSHLLPFLCTLVLKVYTVQGVKESHREERQSYYSSWWSHYGLKEESIGALARLSATSCRWTLQGCVNVSMHHCHSNLEVSTLFCIEWYFPPCLIPFDIAPLFQIQEDY